MEKQWSDMTWQERREERFKKWLAPLKLKVFVFPGEEEMSALASRLIAVLSGKEKERSYDKETALRG
jgi:butyrate kinase